VDTYEPVEVVDYITQSVPVSITNLNLMNMSDYYFGGADNRTRQFSRKQAGEILGSLDRAEQQLREYYEHADENYQIVEGIITPFPLTKRNRTMDSVSTRLSGKPGSLWSYSVSPTGFPFNERNHEITSALYHAWIYRLQECGIVTFYTTNIVDTATLLTSVYKNCQKPEHNILNRYIKQRIDIQEWNPFVVALMHISYAYKIGIGEEKAKEIAKRYNSIFDIAMANASDLCQCSGIGITIAQRLISAIGREGDI
jgi:hypothetical protein